MCAQVDQYKFPEYFYDKSNDRIGYKDHDSISYEKSYGYRTVFAYLAELASGNVSIRNCGNIDAFYKKHLVINVSCGQFSYSDISPSCILGVTGTLEAISSYEQEVQYV